MASSKMTKVVVDKLVGYIQESDIKVGSHLPSERRLAEILGESRGQIRKALNEIEHNGMVESIPQVGTILKSRTPCVSLFQKVLNMGNVDLQSLIEIRISLEITAAGLAAKRATEDEIQIIEKLCEEYGKGALAYADWHDENLNFHMSIIRASKNEAMIAIMENLLNDALAHTRTRASAYTQDRLDRSIAEHRMIVNAIKKRDAKAAEEAMSVHMDKMRAVTDSLNEIMG
ncbi:MAG: FCD domain-containing protein [Eubacteriales bacterium]|nr:FCD domain-containing protein [Eubacteriales bacterium]